MTRVAITGHMDITPDSVSLIRNEISKELSRYSPENLTGVSCIARGADSIFAEVVLERGGQLEVVLPSKNYREAKVKSDHAAVFDELIRRAAYVQVMPFDTADRTAYEAANEVLVTGSDELFAVWDGRPASKGGGTASVVEYARSLDVPVRVIWPAGAERAAS